LLQFSIFYKINILTGYQVVMS